MNEDGRIKELSKKEQASAGPRNEAPVSEFEGIENMDPVAGRPCFDRFQREEIAVKEARRMGVPWFRCRLRIATRTWWMDHSRER